MAPVEQVLALHEIVLGHLPAGGAHLADGASLLRWLGLGSYHGEGGGATAQLIQLAVMLVPGFGGALLIGECRLAVVHVDVGIALEGGDIAIAEDAIVGHRSIFANSLSFLLVCILCGSTLGFLRAVGRPRARKLGGRFAGRCLIACRRGAASGRKGNRKQERQSDADDGGMVFLLRGSLGHDLLLIGVASALPTKNCDKMVKKPSCES